MRSTTCITWTLSGGSDEEAALPLLLATATLAGGTPEQVLVQGMPAMSSWRYWPVKLLTMTGMPSPHAYPRGYELEKPCSQCGQVMRGRPSYVSAREFCSLVCVGKAHTKVINVPCDVCGQQCGRNGHPGVDHRYCSRACQVKHGQLRHRARARMRIARRFILDQPRLVRTLADRRIYNRRVRRRPSYQASGSHR